MDDLAAGASGLTADELLAHADEAWWAGRDDEYVELAEPAYRLLVEAERPRPAARTAFARVVRQIAGTTARTT